jgi:hypothetical protein
MCSVRLVFWSFVEQVCLKAQTASLQVCDLCTSVASHFSASLNRIIVTNLCSFGAYIHVASDVVKPDTMEVTFSSVIR